MDYFNSASAFHAAFMALATEDKEIGARRRVILSGIPELGILGDILGIVDANTPTIVNRQVVDGITVLVYQILNDEAVIDTIPVGCYQIGELEEHRAEIID